MHLSWNKKVLTSSFIIFSMATNLNAMPKKQDPRDQPAENICCEPSKPGPFAFTYPTDLELNCTRDFNIYAEGLAMQAKQEGMDIAIKDTAASPASPSAPITLGEVEGFSSSSSGWDYNPGIRVGFGYNLDHDAFNVSFDWTWMNITNYKSIGAGTSLFIPEWNADPNPLLSVSGSTASAKWNVKYSTIDLSMAKPYHISRYVMLSPFFGVRAGWIDQDFSVRYGGDARQGGLAQMRQHGTNNCNGFGLRGGLSSDWVLGKGWNFFTKISGSLLAAKFDVDQALSQPLEFDGYNLDHDFYQNVTNIEMAMGLTWSKYFNRNKYRVAIRGAYEFIQWFDQLRMKKFFRGGPGYPNDTVSHGDLSLNGFSLRFQIDL